MAVEHIDDDRLQAFFDHELGTGETKIVGAHVTECAECGKRLRRLERLSAIFARTAEDAGAEPELAGMFERVRAGIAKQDKAGFGERFRVWTSEVIEHRKSVVVSVGAAAAVAAAAVIVVLQPFKGDDTHGSTTKVATPTTAQATPGTSTVLAYDFGANAGTVFNVEDDTGGEYAVVWIDEAPAGGEGGH